MNYLLSDADLQYICSVIPRDHVIGYFTKNSKEFSKLQKGFRAKSLTDSQKESILFKGAKANNGFIYSFIDKHITDWLEQIAAHIKEEFEKINDEKQAVLNVLADSNFAENVALYFRLAGLNESEEYIAAAQVKVLSLKQSQVEAAESERRFSELESEIERLSKLLDDAADEKTYLKSRNTTLSIELAEEKKKFKDSICESAKLNERLIEIESSSVTRIETLRNDLKSSENSRQKLLSEIKTLKLLVIDKTATISKLESALEEATSIAKISASVCDATNSVSMIPQDIDWFKECLADNLESFGVRDGKSLLVGHLANILFAGQPIVLERCTAQVFAKCISNILTSGSEVKTLTYSSGLDMDMISTFLACDSRIVVLDNFLGNMNETLLLPLFDNNKDKIIFLGIAYEKTLRYIADDFWIYAKYLNLLHTGGFRIVPQNMEDPSEFEEHPNEVDSMITDSRTTKILAEIADELGLPKKYAINRVYDSKNEEALLGILCFELLPFVRYIIGRNPLTSERLQKYIRISKSAHIDLIKEWYGE